jgi:micrococcal nuclease
MVKYRKLIGLLIIIATSLAGLYLSATKQGVIETPILAFVKPGYYAVTKIYDGDTFEVDMSGHREKVRLIGVDTPETHKPNTPVQCFGPEASTYSTGRLTMQAVRLEADPIGDNRDRYGRLLRYAYLPDGTMLNQILINKGYGFAYLGFAFQKKTEFASGQKSAQNAKLGLWAICQPKLTSGRWQSNIL